MRALENGGKSCFPQLKCLLNSQLFTEFLG